MLATWGTSTGRNPTLDLQFAGATSLDNRITFSRGSQATLFDSTGALVYAKHNLLLQSQTFQTTWSALNVTVSTDTTIAPDGTSTADAIFETATTDRHLVEQTVSFNYEANQTIQFSAYVKANGRTACAITIGSAINFGGVYFDLSNGTVAYTKVVSGTASGSIINVGNGWYRVIGVFSQPSNRTSVFAGIGCSDRVIDSGSYAFSIYPSYAGDVTKGLFIWGSQLNLTPMEGGVTSSLSTYYPTVASAYYAPRFDYNPSTLAAQGLLIEEQRTNSIRNNTMQGAVAGTPGTLPTNWVTTLRGLTQTIVGTGTSNGIAYVDIRFNGTTTSLGGIEIKPDGNAGVIAATASQAWAMSSWVAIVGGSTANTTGQRLILNEYSAGPTYLRTAVAATNILASGSTLARVSGAVTTGASTTIVEPIIILDAASGAAIDITLRIGLPQLEQGAFATSVIPTTTTALTRNADVASMTGTNFSSWFNATAGTLYVQAVGVNNIIGPTRRFAEIGDGTINERFIAGYSTTTNTRWLVQDGGVNQADVQVGTGVPAGSLVKMAAAYAVNDFQQASNGTLGTADTSGTLPTVTTMYLGTDYSSDATNTLNGYIRRISFYPVRLPNSTLQALTA